MNEYQVWCLTGDGHWIMAARMTDKRVLARYIIDVAVTRWSETRIVVVKR